MPKAKAKTTENTGSVRDFIKSVPISKGKKMTFPERQHCQHRTFFKAINFFYTFHSQVKKNS